LLSRPQIPPHKRKHDATKLPEFTANRNAISVKVSMLIPACKGALPQTWAGRTTIGLTPTTM
jgi:hypothetical protein